MTAAEIESTLESLAEAPQRMVAMTSHLENARLCTKPDKDTWSANDILAHLRACADVWGKSILAMIAKDNPTLRHISPRTHIRKTNYLTQDFHTSLQAFTKQRAELLAALKPLTSEGWSRTAIFTGTTRGRDQTVFSYAQRIVEHENPHLDEIQIILNLL
jgi:hypothetical protein